MVTAFSIGSMSHPTDSIRDPLLHLRFHLTRFIPPTVELDHKIRSKRCEAVVISVSDDRPLLRAYEGGFMANSLLREHFRIS
jgi:hypothetical protein